jgi:hypothetical protein
MNRPWSILIPIIHSEIIDHLIDYHIILEENKKPRIVKYFFLPEEP